MTKDVAAEELMPAGSPLTVTVTGPSKPLRAANETTTGELVPPTATEVDDGATDRVKSGIEDREVGDEPLPQAPRRKSPSNPRLVRVICNQSIFRGSAAAAYTDVP
jgi:hypothetical protein